jgi:D-alanine-D-alanine ligase-like ATP-grasp enzyme
VPTRQPRKLNAVAVGESVLSNKHNFYSYYAKYIDDQDILMIPAKLSLAKKKESSFAKKVLLFSSVRRKGRVDFFMTERAK